ncbi:MAG: caspase family protein [Bacteroidales bacterium]|nr:MAG: caspase family protein [Bacteroidales bacterium]
MKKTALLLLLTLVSVTAFSQSEEFVYTISPYGYSVEIRFPSKPIISGSVSSLSDPPNATLNLQVDGGLNYQIMVQKKVALLNWVNTFKRLGGVVKSTYEIGRLKITEMEIQRQGVSYRYKIVSYKEAYILAYVSSQSFAQDKDVFPFFNSLKVDGQLVQNPITDNSKFTAYTIDYPSKGKTDTITKLVYVNSESKKGYQYEKLSDVDKNIPQNTATNPYCFALIIGNEDYTSHQIDLKSESNVEFARNDASAFRDYCTNTLGIPQKNITFLLDATVGQINQGIAKLKLLSKVSNGKSQLIVFYAGHGLPDETTKEPYLIPVDVNGANVTSGIKLQNLYANLTEFPSERVTVYLDACFTGGGRNAGLVESRGVKVRPKEGVLAGNIVVFSSSSGEQSSLPKADEKHGMFTYFLLKKLQETKGEITYSELFESLNEKIPIESLLLNSKEQNPVVNTSQEVTDKWKLWRLK